MGGKGGGGEGSNEKVRITSYLGKKLFPKGLRLHKRLLHFYERLCAFWVFLLVGWLIGWLVCLFSALLGKGLTNGPTTHSVLKIKANASSTMC